MLDELALHPGLPDGQALLQLPSRAIMRVAIPGLGLRPLWSQDPLPVVYLSADPVFVRLPLLEESHPLLLLKLLRGTMLCGTLLRHLRQHCGVCPSKV